MLNDGLNTLLYDAENRLTSSSNQYSGSNAYVYDGRGVRVKKCAPSCTNPVSSTVYIFSGDTLVAEYDNGAAVASPSREYIYAGRQLLATISSGTTTYHHSDHLSVRLSTDSSGNKLGEQGHYPYGEAWYTFNTTTKFLFTSYERDPESGNDYAMARFYISRFGRFCSADPVQGWAADPQSWNRYAYARNDPLNMTDPDGRFWGFFKKVFKFILKLFGFFKKKGFITGIPGSPLPPGRTPPTFPTGPATDWQTLLFGPPDPKHVIIVDNWGGDPVTLQAPGVGTKRGDCPPEKRRFFDWLDKPLGKMAADLGTTKTLMLTLAAKEGGWNKEGLDHNQPLNNPFGVNRINKKGQAAGNKKYPTLDDATEEWKSIFGSRVQGTKTAVDFVRGLQHPETGQPYNTATETWEKQFHEIEMSKWMERCGITP
jgi:RHS repeat-associated protein